MGFGNLVVRANPSAAKPKTVKASKPKTVKAPKPKKAKAEKPPGSGAKKDNEWGGPEERYRRLCLLCQLCRFAYYTKSTSIIPDVMYDRAERVVLRIEEKDRSIIDQRRSPSFTVGTDDPSGYPTTVRSLWDFCGDDPRTFSSMQAVVDKAIENAAKSFDVSSI